MIVIHPNITIASTEYDLSFSRSSGPGGQNVNKVNSKVTLRWRLQDSISIPLAVKERLLVHVGSKMTQEGELVVQSDRYRDQLRNIEECKNKIKQIVLKYLAPPPPRKKTRPSLAQKAKRLSAKKEQSEKKQRRKPFRFE